MLQTCLAVVPRPLNPESLGIARQLPWMRPSMTKAQKLALKQSKNASALGKQSPSNHQPAALNVKNYRLVDGAFVVGKSGRIVQRDWNGFYLPLLL